MHSKLLYGCYYYTMSAFVNILKFLVTPDDRLVLFVSFGGRYFNDSPKCLYDRMKVDERFKGLKLVWAFRDPSQFPEVEHRVKIDSFKYYVTALKARCWITNVLIERGLDFKGKHTYYFNTTHTILPKLTGVQVKDVTFTSKASNKCDCFTVQCEFEREIMGGDKNLIKVIGYPKSDILANYTEAYRLEMRKRLNLPDDKKVILYAPTFREGYLKDRDMPVDFKKWESILGDDYLVLFRAHPVVALKIKVDPSSTFVRDVSDYPDNNDLIIASDILISDYSGILVEFGVQKKPMFIYTYDYEDYQKTRGLFFDIRQELPGGYMNEDELIHYIKNGDPDEIMKQVDEFRKKYITAYGHATESSLDIIYDHIAK